jgi:hypothetical protein
MSQIRTFLAGCTATAVALAVVLALAGAINPTRARFDEITVGRINVEEPDGTKRLVISNRAQFPGDLTLKDAKGKPRMQLLVTAQGKAEIRILDENGKVLKTVTAEN